jgi:ubiquinone/menaquinone biosynthesis C-methylase UbiE
MESLPLLERDVDLSDARVVSAYDEVSLWSAMFGLLLLEQVLLPARGTVLDIGCGTGFPLIELAERLGPECHVHGIDPWTAGLDRARAKIEARGTANITLHEGSASALPFAGATFDLIVSNLGINNFDDPPAAIRECRRVLRPGATLALTTNLQGHMTELYEELEVVIANLGDAAAQNRFDENVRHRATAESARDLLEQNGVSVRRIIQREGTMRFANGTAFLNHHFIRLGFLPAWKRIVPGREREMFTKLLERLNARANREGALSLTIPMAYIEGFVEPAG